MFLYYVISFLSQIEQCLIELIIPNIKGFQGGLKPLIFGPLQRGHLVQLIHNQGVLPYNTTTTSALCQ
jgi:hypothetical protein